MNGLNSRLRKSWSGQAWAENFIIADEDVISKELAWLTSIGSDNNEHTEMKVDKGTMPVLIDMLKSTSDAVKEQALRCIGKIAGNNHNRGYVIDCGAIQPIINNRDH